MSDPNLLIGPEQFSDAGVYRLGDDLAIVQTVDFFSPIVGDPFVYGQIAAANALSDCYAVGAQPRTALNIVGFPEGDLEMEVLAEILRGGSERVQLAGAVIVGGHTVRDSEVKYGLAVTGTVDPARMLSNAGARPGDALVLTKALGTGLITTASKSGRGSDESVRAAQESMVMLNRAGSEAAMSLESSGATDITGFGFAVHALEMAQASGVCLGIDMAELPLLAGALDVAVPENHSRANPQNRARAWPSIRSEGQVDQKLMELIFDPQTSGGLLVAIHPSRAGELVERSIDGGLTDSRVVGEVLELGSEALVLRW